MIKIIIILLFIFNTSKSSDFELVATESMGTDFWVSFPPNIHFPGGLEYEIRDSLFLFIGSNEPTEVRFTYWDYEDNEYSTTLTITDPLRYETFGIPWWKFEMPAQTSNFHRWRNGREYIQEPVKLSIHIESDKPIILLGHSQALYSSDGMLVYPTSVLGTHYITACYTSTYESRRTHRASHFSIVATDDSTDIIIIPKQELSRIHSDTLSIMLNKGEVYYARAAFVDGQEDLTGSEIISNKPVAVYSGVERTNIPNSSTFSRDYLVTQLTSFDKSGIEYIVTPFYNNSFFGLDTTFHSKYRIISYFDDTEIYVNDQYLTKLNKGEYVENDILEAYHIRTSKTTYVYSIRRSAVSDEIYQEIGDPFLLINPPIQQFNNAFKAINFNYHEIEINKVDYFDEELGEYAERYDSTFQNIYTEHYITLVLEENAISETLIDGAPLPNNLEFTKIHNTNYIFAHVRVNAGTHNIISNGNMLCYAYGYGYANSYGSVAGGLNVNILDHHPPQIDKVKNCSDYEISYTETNFADTGLDSLKILVNSNILISDNLNGDSLRTADAIFSLVDPYQDGYIEYRVYDKFGLYQSDTIQIPGFTLSQELIYPEIDNRGHKLINDFDAILRITNYGNFSQDLKLILADNILLMNNLPNVIAPKQVIDINIKIEKEYFKNNDYLNISSILEHNCFEEKETIQSIKIWLDDINPQFEIQSFEYCENIYDIINITEENELDYGINSIEYIELSNIDIEEDFSETNTKIKASLINIFQNGYYSIKVTDFNNNETTFEQSVGGILIELEFDNSYTFENVELNSFRCDSVYISNNSLKPFILDNNTFKENKFFSIPSSQLPIIIPPKSKMPLLICFDAQNTENVEDSLLIILNECFSNYYPINTIITNNPKNLNSNCDLQISISKLTSNNFNLSNPYPNPTSDNITLNINNNQERIIIFRLFNALGNEVFSHSEKYNKANYNLSFSFKNIPNGNYIFQIQSPDHSENHKILIIK